MSIMDLVRYMQNKEESRKESKAENARYAKPNGETWCASTSTTSGISSASESNYPGNFQNLKSAVNLPQYNYSAGQNHNNQHLKQGCNAQTIEYELQQQVPTKINLRVVRVENA